jgi:hypothetical protein
VAKQKYTLNTSETTAETNTITTTNEMNWAQGGGGHWNLTIAAASEWEYTPRNWPADAGYYPPVLSGLGSYYDSGPVYTNADIGVPDVEWIESAAIGGVDMNDSPTNDIAPLAWTATAGQVVKLFTGGRALRGVKSLFVLSQALSKLKFYALDDYEYEGDYAGDVPSQEIALGAYGNQGADTNLYVALKNGRNVVVTPNAPAIWYGGGMMSMQKYSVVHHTEQTAFANPDWNRTTVGVAEQVDLSFDPTPWFVFDWTTTAGGLSATTNVYATTFTAPSNAAPNVIVTATIRGGKSVAFPPFNVLEPIGIDHAQIVGTNHFSIGEAGSIMTNAVWIAPTSVSFYKVQIMEVGLQATNVTGYFTNLPSSDLNHHNQGADQWFYLTSNNKWWDVAGGGPLLPPWTIGGFTWDIPARWKVGNGNTNSMSGWNQSLSIDANGTVTIHKFGNTMTRDTNDVINTN